MSYFLWVVLLLLQVNEGANDAATMGRQQVLQYGQGHNNLFGSQSARTRQASLGLMLPGGKEQEPPAGGKKLSWAS